MSCDVFISYGSPDREAAKEIATLLKQSGFTVWWDNNIEPGKQFADAIDDAISSCRVIIVLWSQYSVKSDWVKAEALEGLERKILLPVSLDSARTPFAFRALNTVKLIGWPDHQPDEIGRLTDRVSVLLNGPGAAVTDVEVVEQDADLDTSGPDDFGIGDTQKHRITLLRCNIILSDDGSMVSDPESIMDLLPQLHEIAERLCDQYGATCSFMEGSTFELLYGHPFASDGDSVKAVATGLAIVDELEHLNSEGRKYKLMAAIGIHSNEVVIRLQADGSVKIVGNASQHTIWLQTQSQTNCVTLDEFTYKLLRDRVECDELGPRVNHQTATSVKVYQATGLKEGNAGLQNSQDSLPAMQGRESELNLLLDRWEDAQEGDSRFVILQGEAGIGKTRVIKEMINRTQHTDSFLPMTMYCSQLGKNIPFQPIIEYFMGSGLGLRKLDSLEKKTNRIRKVLLQAGVDAGVAAPLISSLLSFENRFADKRQVSNEAKRKELLSYLVKIVTSASKHNALLLVIEDLHWADPSTLEIIELLISEESQAGMLCIFTSRPGTVFDWSARSNVTTMNLGKLSKRATKELILNSTAGQELSEELIQRLVAEAAGSPLFAEELAKGVVEFDQYFEQQQAEKWVLPNTLQQLLSTKLDNLGSAKPLAQLCSLLGREFGYELLLAASHAKSEKKLNKDLASLVTAELLYQSGSVPNSRYQFKHALIRDTAYQSILSSKRQELHARVAESIAGISQATGESLDAILAHHYEFSNQLDKAIDCYFSACQKSLHSCALKEAIEFADKGLALMERLTDSSKILREIALLSLLGKALIDSRGYSHPRVEEVFSRAVSLCDSVDESPQLFQLLVGLWGYFQIAGMKEQEFDLAQKLVHTAQLEHSPAKLVQAMYCMGFTLFKRGEFKLASEKFEEGLKLTNDNSSDDYCQYTLSGDDSRIHIHGVLALIQCYLGDNDRAIELSDQSIALAKETDNKISIVWALFFRSWLMSIMRDVEETGNYAGQSLVISQEYDFSFWIFNSMYLKKWSLFHLEVEDSDDARRNKILEMAGILEGFMNIGVRFGVLSMHVEVCLAFIEINDIDSAMNWIQKSWELLDDCGEEYLRGDLHRIEGLIAFKKDDSRAALDSFNAAREVASKASNKNLLLKLDADSSKIELASN